MVDSRFLATSGDPILVLQGSDPCPRCIYKEYAEATRPANGGTNYNHDHIAWPSINGSAVSKGFLGTTASCVTWLLLSSV